MATAHSTLNAIKSLPVQSTSEQGGAEREREVEVRAEKERERYRKRWKEKLGVKSEYWQKDTRQRGREQSRGRVRVFRELCNLMCIFGRPVFILHLPEESYLIR